MDVIIKNFICDLHIGELKFLLNDNHYHHVIVGISEMLMSAIKKKSKISKKKSKDREYLFLVESASKKFSTEKSNVDNLSEFASIPYKAKPCKKCRALAGGLCKCALKKIK